MLWQESGGPDYANAWQTRPLQIGNPGDPALRVLQRRAENTDLIITPELQDKVQNNKQIDARTNIRAGFAYLLNRAVQTKNVEVIDNQDVQTVTIEKGDSLEKIAKRVGTTIDSLRRESGLSEKQLLKPGEQLNYRQAHFEKQIFSWSDWWQAVKSYNGGGDSEVRCETGAYNVSNIYLLYDETQDSPKAQILEFPTLMFPNRSPDEKPVEIITKIVGGRKFDIKTKELTVFVKGRGLGDFGEYARYAFSGGKPLLKEFRAQLTEGGFAYQADDIFLRSPQKWTRYYP